MGVRRGPDGGQTRVRPGSDQGQTRVRRGSVPLTVAAALAVALVLPTRAEVIDRILAVVGGDLVTLSDVTVAIRFGLIDVPGGTPDPIKAALDQLIERRLQLTEVTRYLPPEPADAEVDLQFDALRARFASDAAFAQALDETGISADQLRGRVRENLRIASYRNQRFAAPLQPTEEDLVGYYRDHQSAFMKGGTLPRFADVREEVRRRVIAERNESLIRNWIQGLRRRTEVTILYSSPATVGRDE